MLTAIHSQYAFPDCEDVVMWNLVFSRFTA